MKKTKLPKKLVLTKKTVANLDFSQQRMIKGGYLTNTCPFKPTKIFPDCLFDTIVYCSANPNECP